MTFEAYPRVFRVWPLVAVAFWMISSVHPSCSNEITQELAVGTITTNIQFWEFKHVNDVFMSGRTVYLDLTTASGPKRLWNPMTGAFSSSDLTIGTLRRARFISIYSPDSLPNGGAIEMSIVSTSPRCGYTVGADITYTGSDGVPAAFYIIEKYKSLKKTFYCGTPLKQRYDVEIGNVSPSLPDGRLLIVDFAKKTAVAFLRVPSTIVALDDESFLVPADFLQKGLDAAGDNQGARYRTLLATLRSHPATVIQPTRVE